MLKKYKQSGTSLRIRDMKQIKGGKADNEFQPPECLKASDCGNPVCEAPTYEYYVCVAHRCYSYLCG